ncbi:general transcription factor IIH subunit 4-like isoform X2 [Lineus longissimus]
MRVLFVEQPVHQSVVASWTVNKFVDDHRHASQILSDLRVWNDHTMPGGLQGWILNSVFRKNLKVALLGGGSAWVGTGNLAPDKHGKDVEFLDSYCKERWECVLHFMVGSKEATDGVSRDVVEILLHAGLMKGEPGGGAPNITPAGFQFLLLDTPTQIWHFMLHYLETVESRGMDLVQSLSFLFQLSFSTLGKDYSTDGLDENQFKLLQHLREFGLVYQRKRKSHRYYPTRLAINLASGLSKNSVDTNSKEGYIVVETNYRVYAYTGSALQVALLALFCEMLYRFPNMCVANITRDSVRQALQMGITAEQILHFLRSNAHPETLKHTPVIPATVSDQIRLWELERDRFKFNDGVLYNQFLSQNDFELLRDYAKDLGVLIWDNTPKRTMIVSRAGHDDVKKFWKRHKPG